MIDVWKIKKGLRTIGAKVIHIISQNPQKIKQQLNKYVYLQDF